MPKKRVNQTPTTKGTDTTSKATTTTSKPKVKSLKTVKAKVDTKAPASKTVKKPSAEPQMRQNFVRLNTKQNYKPHLRGAAFTNKIMAKKRNFVRFNDKMKKRL